MIGYITGKCGRLTWAASTGHQLHVGSEAKSDFDQGSGVSGK